MGIKGERAANTIRAGEGTQNPVEQLKRSDGATRLALHTADSSFVPGLIIPGEMPKRRARSSA